MDEPKEELKDKIKEMVDCINNEQILKYICIVIEDILEEQKNE